MKLGELGAMGWVSKQQYEVGGEIMTYLHAWSFPL